MTRFQSIAVSIALLAGITSWAAIAIPRGEGSGRASTDRQSAAEATFPPLPRDDWSIGEQRIYDVEQRAVIASKQQRGSATIEVAGAFELTLTPFEKSARGTTVRVDVRAKEVTRKEQGAAASMTAEVAAALSTQSAIVVDASGTVRQIYGAPEMSSTADAFLRGMLSALQITAPDPATERTWTVSEMDVSGKYSARYERTGALALRKVKSRFDGEAEPALGVKGRTRSARVEYVLAADSGIAQQVLGTSEEVTTLEQTELRSTGRTRLVLRRVAQVTPIGVALDRHRAGTLFDAPYAVRLTPEQYAEIAKGHTVASLLHEVGAGDRGDNNARAELMTRLEAVLRTEGDAAVAAVAEAAKTIENDDDARLLMGALDGSRAPAAQRALLGLARQGELAPDRRTTALMHLGLGETPTVEVLDGLRGMSEDGELDAELRDTSSLALGGALRNADADTKAGTSASVAYLLGRSASAKTERERAIALEALGNTGSDEALPVLKDALDEPSSWLRASATNGLRHLHDAQADELLSEIATTDPEASVRQRALSALLYRSLTDATRKVLLNALGEDADVGVRLTAVDVMSSYLDEEDAFAGALARSSEQDPDERVRERALAVLNSDSIVR